MFRRHVRCLVGLGPRLGRLVAVSRRGVLLAVLVGGSITALASCASFGAASDTTGGEGGAGEGAVLEGGAPVVDGEVSDVRRPCMAPSCTDFDNGAWPAKWNVVGDGGALTVSEGQTTSGKFALDVVFTHEVAFLAIDVAKATKVTVTANVVVVAFGDGEVDLLGIAEKQATNVPGVYLIQKGRSPFLEIPGSPGVSLASSFATFTPITLVVDGAGQTYAYTVGGETVRGVLLPALNVTTLSVLIGGVFSSGVTIPWHVRYDDVEIVVTQ